MSKNKKSRAGKKRTVRALKIPLMKETADSISLKMYAAMETLIERPSIESYNAVSLNLMTIGRAFGRHDPIEAVKQTMLDIYARFERVGKIGVSALEAQALRAASGEIGTLIPTLSLDEWAVADMLSVEQANNAKWVPIASPEERSA